MSDPKRHHYVPQFLLRGFVDGRGFLHVYRKKDGKQWTAKPENTFLEGHLYSTLEDNGHRDPALERAYAKMEGDASILVDKFINAARNRTTLVLTEDEKGIWGYFFYQQIKRVPEMFRQLEVQRTFADRLNDVIQKLEQRIGRPLTEEESRDLRAPESLARIQ